MSAIMYDTVEKAYCEVPVPDEEREEIYKDLSSTKPEEFLENVHKRTP